MDITVYRNLTQTQPPGFLSLAAARCRGRAVFGIFGLRDSVKATLLAPCWYGVGVLVLLGDRSLDPWEQLAASRNCNVKDHKRPNGIGQHSS
jgi:hypothetical protein